MQLRPNDARRLCIHARLPETRRAAQCCVIASVFLPPPMAALRCGEAGGEPQAPETRRHAGEPPRNARPKPIPLSLKVNKTYERRTCVLRRSGSSAVNTG